MWTQSYELTDCAVALWLCEFLFQVLQTFSQWADTGPSVSSKDLSVISSARYHNDEWTLWPLFRIRGSMIVLRGWTSVIHSPGLTTPASSQVVARLYPCIWFWAFLRKVIWIASPKLTLLAPYYLEAWLPACEFKSYADYNSFYSDFVSL